MTLEASAADLATLERALAARRGAPLVVHHFATWCDPCEEELPLLARLLRDHAAGAAKVAVSWDLFLAPGPPEAAVEACRAFLAAAGADFDLLYVFTGAPPALFASQRLATGTVPYTEVRDARGERVAEFPEPLLDEESHARFAAALAQAAPAASAPPEGTPR